MSVILSIARIAGLVCILLTALPASAQEVTDLPVTEVPAGTNTSSRFALLLTGDGGWASLDKAVSHRLAASGLSVVGFDSLKYYWTPRTPQNAATDVERVLRHYLQEWEKTDVLLLGYSFGADVLPSIVNRLPADLRARIVAIALVGLAHDVTWEVKLTDWIPGLARVGTPIAPEIARLPPIPLLCLYGKGEKSLCPELSRERATAVAMGKGHHLGGDYELIADRILEFSRSRELP
jgi:type IV secretory pathway VirJ component